MGSCGSSSKQGAGSAAKQSPIKYLSSDNALYESPDEVIYAERIVGSGFGSVRDVLSAQSDGKGNLTLKYAQPEEYYEQNSKTTYGLYELKSGITNAERIHGSREFNDRRATESKVKPENEYGEIKSVGIDWNKVNSVTGQTYNIKGLLKDKGFKWNGADKSWKK